MRSSSPLCTSKSVVRPSAGSPRTTLAVLPFQNLSNDAEQEFFSDGFTEEMIAELGTLDPGHLGVIARTTTMLYKNARKDVGQIRKDLGVDYVLEGSIRRAGSRMRITAQLVQTTDMTHLWAESYDRDVSDVLAIQREVAMKIAHSLTLALQRPRAERGSTAASFPAYELCLRGKFFREQATEEGARKAIEYFQRAIAIDPVLCAGALRIGGLVSAAGRSRMGGRPARGSASQGQGRRRARVAARSRVVRGACRALDGEARLRMGPCGLGA